MSMLDSAGCLAIGKALASRDAGQRREQGVDKGGTWLKQPAGQEAITEGGSIRQGNAGSKGASPLASSKLIAESGRSGKMLAST